MKPPRFKHRVLHADLVREPPHLAALVPGALSDEIVAQQLSHFKNWRKGVARATPNRSLIEVVLRRHLWLLRESAKRRKAATS